MTCAGPTATADGSQQRRRCELVVPASNDRYLKSAAASTADSICIDLEDGVAGSEKAAGRVLAAERLTTLDWGGRRCSVRVNPVGTDDFYYDIEALASAGSQALSALVLSKVRTAADVVVAAEFVRHMESHYQLNRTLKIGVMIETAAALVNVQQIACSHPRIDTLILGSGDLAVELCSRVFGLTEDQLTKHLPRQLVLLAARHAGVMAIDGPCFSGIGDLARLQLDSDVAAKYGLDGKWIIHPSHIDIVKRSFSPSEGETAWAHDVLVRYTDGVADGQGAVTGKDGEVIDHATVFAAQRLLRQSEPQDHEGVATSRESGQ